MNKSLVQQVFVECQAPGCASVLQVVVPSTHRQGNGEVLVRCGRCQKLLRVQLPDELLEAALPPLVPDPTAAHMARLPRTDGSSQGQQQLYQHQEPSQLQLPCSSSAAATYVDLQGGALHPAPPGSQGLGGVSASWAQQQRRQHLQQFLEPMEPGAGLGISSLQQHEHTYAQQHHLQLQYQQHQQPDPYGPATHHAAPSSMPPSAYDAQQATGTGRGLRRRRPSTAYHEFIRDEMKRLKSCHPHLDHQAAFKLAASTWVTSGAKAAADQSRDQQQLLELSRDDRLAQVELQREYAAATSTSLAAAAAAAQGGLPAATNSAATMAPYERSAPQGMGLQPEDSQPGAVWNPQSQSSQRFVQEPLAPLSAVAGAVQVLPGAALPPVVAAAAEAGDTVAVAAAHLTEVGQGWQLGAAPGSVSQAAAEPNADRTPEPTTTHTSRDTPSLSQSCPEVGVSPDRAQQQWPRDADHHKTGRSTGLGPTASCAASGTPHGSASLRPAPQGVPQPTAAAATVATDMPPPPARGSSNSSDTANNQQATALVVAASSSATPGLTALQSESATTLRQAEPDSGSRVVPPHAAVPAVAAPVTAAISASGHGSTSSQQDASPAPMTLQETWESLCRKHGVSTTLAEGHPGTAGPPAACPAGQPAAAPLQIGKQRTQAVSAAAAHTGLVPTVNPGVTTASFEATTHSKACAPAPPQQQQLLAAGHRPDSLAASAQASKEAQQFAACVASDAEQPGRQQEQQAEPWTTPCAPVAATPLISEGSSLASWCSSLGQPGAAEADRESQEGQGIVSPGSGSGAAGGSAPTGSLLCHNSGPITTGFLPRQGSKPVGYSITTAGPGPPPALG